MNGRQIPCACAAQPGHFSFTIRLYYLLWFGRFSLTSGGVWCAGLGYGHHDLGSGSQDDSSVFLFLSAVLQSVSCSLFFTDWLQADRWLIVFPLSSGRSVCCDWDVFRLHWVACGALIWVTVIMIQARVCRMIQAFFFSYRLFCKGYSCSLFFTDWLQADRWLIVFPLSSGCSVCCDWGVFRLHRAECGVLVWVTVIMIQVRVCRMIYAFFFSYRLVLQRVFLLPLLYW